MKLKSFVIILSLFALISCEVDFDVNADWKDITIVYGLLDPNAKDSVHYLKIGKAFTNEGMNADSIALKYIDSLYYTDSLTVKLEPWQNNVHLQPDIYFFKSYNENKNTDGDFYAPGQYIYRTEKGTALNTNYTYKLVIENPKTGKRVTSETNVAGDMTLVRPVINGLIHFDTAGKTKVIWRAGENAFFYNFDLVFRYYEYPRNKPQQREVKSFTWRIVSSYRSPTSGSTEMEVEVEGLKFYEILLKNVEKDLSLQREFPKDHLDLVFTAGGKEFYYYNNVNQPAVGLVQKKPEYTNIHNGLGVFSTRNVNTYTIELTSLAKEYIMTSDETIDLNFIE